MPGSLTVNAAALTITANDRTKVYGQTVTFAGTEFTTTGLLNADTVTIVTLTSAGRRADRDGRRQPVPDHAVGGVGTGLANYTITLRHRRASR